MIPKFGHGEIVYIPHYKELGTVHGIELTPLRNCLTGSKELKKPTFRYSVLSFNAEAPPMYFLEEELTRHDGHPHSFNMLEYARDAMVSRTPWTKWEKWVPDIDGGKWVTLSTHPLWEWNIIYRRKVEQFEVPF